MNNINDMTEGKPLPLLVRFSLPMIAANVLQLLYTMADSAVVGRMLGVTAFAAVGATAAIYWMVLSIIISMSHGFGILFAQRFGAKDIGGLRRAFITAIYLTAVIGAAVGGAGIVGSGMVLELLDTPPELLAGASVYLQWLSGGIIIALAYNVLSAMLRALGDSKTPLKSIIITSLLNIALDVALVGPLGIAGVAIATLLSQLAACLYCAAVLRGAGRGTGRGAGRGTGAVLGASGNSAIYIWGTVHGAQPAAVAFDAKSAAALLRLGLPLAFRNGAIEIGGLVVQRFVNAYGVEFVAGIAAAKRMYSLLGLAGGAYEAANGTYAAQNFGAGKLDRVKLGVVYGRRLMLISAAIIMAIIIPLRYSILGLLLEGDPVQVKAVLDIGARQLLIMTIGLPLLNLLFLYRSTLDGIGKPQFSVISGFLELAMRIAAVLFLAPAISEAGIMISDPAGWVAALALLLAAYYAIIKKLAKRDSP